MKFELMMKKLFKKIVSGLAPPDDENPRNTSTCQQQSAPLGDAHLLPILWPLKKNAQPWNMSWHKFPDRISCDGTVLRFQFVPGVFGLKSGCAFRANPFRSLPADSCMFRYSVYFPPEFNWVKGGKLPGVNFGTAPNKCSTGGDWCCDSGSFRIMFRQNGDAIGYAYMALPGGGPGSFAAQRPEVQAVSKVKGEAGIDMWHAKTNTKNMRRREGEGEGGAPYAAGLKLHAGQWNSVEISLRLNSPGQSDGWVAVTVNGDTKSAEGMLWRTAPEVKLCAVNFVAFFGGGTKEWASPVETWCAFKDVEFAAW